MSTLTTCFGGLRGLIVLGVLIAAQVATATDTIYVVDSLNNLSQFDSATPGTLSTTPISGLVAGDAIVGIDFRPATGRLYALGVNSATAHLYTLNTITGAATQVGGDIALPQSAGAAVDSAFGFDFDPVLDQIRVVSIFKDNFRLNPDTGAVAGADTALSVLFIAGLAYDRNAPGLGATTLFGINAGSSDALVLQGGVDGSPSPNGGVITPIGPLGVDTSVLVGFDIAPPAQGGTAFAALFVSASGNSEFYSIDLTTGQATLIGAIGTGTPSIRALAIAVPAPTAAPALSRQALIVAVLVLVAFGCAQLSRRKKAERAGTSLMTVRRA